VGVYVRGFLCAGVARINFVYFINKLCGVCDGYG